MLDLLGTLGLTVLAYMVGISFVEWAFHRYVMHKPFPGFNYPYRTHACVHHKIFRGDESYLLSNHPHDIARVSRERIAMDWWAQFVLVGAGIMPAILISWLSGNWWITITAVIVCWTYYGAYEGMHWCMHNPNNWLIEHLGFFKWLDRHHRLHHLSMTQVNFNVVLPLADLLCGTLRTKPAPSKRSPYFAQASIFTGPT